MVHLKLTLAALVVCAVGCVEPDTEPVGSESQPLYVDTGHLWPSGPIEVCWEDTGFADEKRWVREAIEGSWQRVANVTFVGWGDCTSGQDGIRITPGDSMVVRGGLGERDGRSRMELDFSASPQTRWTRCTSNSLSREACIRSVSTHEFGHSLGFAHEHNRPDTPDSCTREPQGSNGDTTVGPWDGDSIMNYCSTSTVISDGDIRGVIQMYGLSALLTMVAVM